MNEPIKGQPDTPYTIHTVLQELCQGTPIKIAHFDGYLGNRSLIRCQVSDPHAILQTYAIVGIVFYESDCIRIGTTDSMAALPHDQVKINLADPDFCWKARLELEKFVILNG